MKAWINRLKIVFLALICVLGIAGCSAGSSVATKLTVNADLSGVRVMDVAIDGSVFAENFHGDINALNAVVESSCPKELTWTYDNSDGTDRYHVELAFTSPEDYKKKVESIMGGEVDLEVSAPETVWANGFRVYESFSSTDLLGWLKEVLVEQELVNQSDASYIFENGTTEVVFAGETYSANSSIQVNQLRYLSLDRVDVLTNVKDQNSFDRSVVIYIPKESMTVKKAEIEAFLNGNVPEGAVSSWDTYDNGTKMTISRENMDLNGLNSFDQKVLASDQNMIEVAQRANEEGVFSFANSWSEQLDLSSYAGDESGKVRFGYYVKTENGVALESDPEAGMSFRPQEDDTYPSYQIAKSEKIAETAIQFQMVKSYLIQNTNVTTEAKSKDNFVRTTEFVVAEVPKAEEQTAIIDRITAKAVDLAEITSVSDETGFSVTVTQKGGSEAIRDSSAAVYGRAGSIGKAEEKGLMAFSHRIGFHEQFDYSQFLNGAVTEDHMITYTAKMGLFESISKKSLPQDELDSPVVKGGTVTYELAGSAANIQFAGSRINLIGVILWVVILAAAVFLALKLVKTGVFVMVKEDLAGLQEQRRQKAAAADVSGGVSEQMQAQMEAAAAVTHFCPECGQPYEEGTAFCENCGTKLTE